MVLSSIWRSGRVLFLFRDTSRLVQAILLACVFAGCSVSASASDFPGRPVRLIVPFSPGGTLDVVARLLAARLRDTWGQPILVENRVGGNGSVGVEHVARSAPDGHTLLFNATLVVITQQLQRTSFDVNRDLIGVIQTTAFSNVLAVHPKLSVSTIEEFIALAKKEPGRLNYGSGGNGSSLHLYMELLKNAAQIDLTHVPYKGSAPAVQALLAGEVDAVFDTTSGMLPHIKSGKIRPLMITGTKPLDGYGSVRTMDSTFSGLNLDFWQGIFVPAGTPRAIVEQIAADVRAVLLSPAMTTRLREMGFEPTAVGPGQFLGILKNDYDRWGKLIRENNIRAD